MRNKPLIISVSAISGGGKTTVTKSLKERFKKACAFYFDNYEYDKQPENIGLWIENGSNPNEWDLSLIEKDINNAIQSNEYEYILLDYPFGKRDGYILKQLIDMAFFIDTPLDIALSRRIVRDFTDLKATDIISELKAYPSIRKYFVYTNDNKKYYDYIIDGSKSVELIVEDIRTKIL